MQAVAELKLGRLEDCEKSLSLGLSLSADDKFLLEVKKQLKLEQEKREKEREEQEKEKEGNEVRWGLGLSKKRNEALLDWEETDGSG